MGMSPRTGDAPLKISTVVGVAAAIVLAVLLNVIGSRHFRRWDATSGGLYTLSGATRETLRALEEPVVIHVLVPEGDPLRASLDQMLLAYRAESSRVEVRATDPDRAPAEFLAVQRKYGVTAARGDDGAVIMDAAVVVARADAPYFLTARDLAEPDQADPLRTRPRIEEALTSAIRRIVGGVRPRVCFTEGHGERSVDVAGDDGLAVFKDRLIKNNLEVLSVWTEGAEPTAPFEGCTLAIVAGPTQPLPERHVAQLGRFVESGGNALLVVGPVPREDDGGFVPLGDAPLLALAGVRRTDDFIFELDEDRRIARGFGETFLPIVAPHPITSGLDRHGGDVVLTVASSLDDLGTSLAPAPLLTTSARAFGMNDFFGWAKAPGEPVAREGDRSGPLTVAFATERPATPGQQRGARLVVFGTTSVLAQANWREPELAATAAVVEGAVAWLASHRAFLDIPSKPTVMTQLDVTEAGLTTVFRTAVVLLPAAAALGGVLVWLRRRREVPGVVARRPGGPP